MSCSHAIEPVQECALGEWATSLRMSVHEEVTVILQIIHQEVILQFQDGADGAGLHCTVDIFAIPGTFGVRQPEDHDVVVMTIHCGMNVKAFDVGAGSKLSREGTVNSLAC